MAIALDSRAVVTTDEARTALGIASGASEEQLRLAINRATYRLEAFCGVGLVQTTYVERHTGLSHDGRGVMPWTAEGFTGGGTKFLYLQHYPVVSITSIVDEASTPTSIAAADYYVRKDVGILEHYSVWPTPYKYASGTEIPGEWIVTLVAGWFASVAAVTWDVKDACLSLVAEALYRTSGSVSEIESGTLRVKFAGEGENAKLPPNVRATMGRYKIGRVS